jgi:hypothetical protein
MSQVYMFNNADARSPFERSADFGFRCAKYVLTGAATKAADPGLEFSGHNVAVFCHGCTAVYIVSLAFDFFSTPLQQTASETHITHGADSELAGAQARTAPGREWPKNSCGPLLVILKKAAAFMNPSVPVACTI